MTRPWSAKFCYVTCNNKVPASKITHFVSLKKRSWLMLNTEIIAVVVRTIQKPQILPVSKIQGFLSCQSMGYIYVITALQHYSMSFCVEARLITGSCFPLRLQWWRNRHFLLVDWANPLRAPSCQVKLLHPYLPLEFPRSLSLFFILPSLPFTYSILYFERSPYCCSFSFLLLNALLFLFNSCIFFFSFFHLL